ncbi:(Lyso)-N-acylphosphatidylethanolamine lipase-like [Ptychodera flava]|uniref:(Lyso)-N-acylphosphatidylethanolamine lipase-like n=1 Tax=Ptychodera flava TaxID=63121 RepID=UPI00396A2E60
MADMKTEARAQVSTNSEPFYKFKWIPSSAELLEAAEKRILRYVKTRYEGRFVPCNTGQSRLWTLMFNSKHPSRMPFVFVHGFGAGVGLWAQNIDPLCQQRPFCAFDLLGFGRSSRTKFSKSAVLAEQQFVESMEQWRNQLKLDKMILVGHSFGGYLVSSYAMKYPDHVQHLVLVDPWGFPEKPDNFESRFPVWVRAIGTVIMTVTGTILSVVRTAGPYGPDLIKKGRPDLQGKFSELFDDDTITNYIYHCNAQDPSGEKAFKTLMSSWGFAKRPMIHRIHEVRQDIPITFIYGAKTYSIIDSSMGRKTQEIRQGSYVKVHMIENAGHHVYADQPKQFNDLLKQTCEDIP